MAGVARNGWKRVSTVRLYPTLFFRPCLVCKGPTRRIYCSSRCVGISHADQYRNRVAKTCVQCRKGYEIIPAKAEKSRYCSNVCKRQFLRKRHDITCARCEKVFPPGSGKIYCSRKCMIRPRPIHICEQCGNEFMVGHINQPGRFCSKDCKDIFQNGPQNPNFKGAPAIKYGWDWWQIRQQVIERDQATCQKCGKRNLVRRDLNVHHIIPFRICRSHDPDNLVVLCDSCHGRIETRLPMKGRPVEIPAYA